MSKCEVQCPLTVLGSLQTAKLHILLESCGVERSLVETERWRGAERRIGAIWLSIGLLTWDRQPRKKDWEGNNERIMTSKTYRRYR